MGGGMGRTIRAMVERMGTNIVLMGLRGSGKSTLGRRLEAALGRTFVDLDDLTVKHLGGEGVVEVWERVGEAGFRAAEVAALREVLKGNETGGRIFALGGGTPTAPGAQEIIREAVRDGAVVVYLRAMPNSLRARLKASDIGDRPALSGGTGRVDMLDEIETVFDERDALYRELATVVLETDGLDEALVLSRLKQIVT
jgi:shikimate kinase